MAASTPSRALRSPLTPAEACQVDPLPPGDAASAAECPIGLLLVNAPSTDMALGSANATTNNAPLSFSSGQGGAQEFVQDQRNC